jgi:hypothetical protein
LARRNVGAAEGGRMRRKEKRRKMKGELAIGKLGGNEAELCRGYLVGQLRSELHLYRKQLLKRPFIYIRISLLYPA